MRILLVLLASIILAQNPGPAVTGATAGGCVGLPSPTPAAFWRIEGDISSTSGCAPSLNTTVYDLTGGGANGTWSGESAGNIGTPGSTWYSYTPARTATLYTGEFNGSSTLINIGTPASIASLQVPLTISCWVKNPSGTIADGSIFTRYSLTTGGRLWYILGYTSTEYSYYMSTSSGGYQVFFYSTIPSATVWHMLTDVVSGSVSSPGLTIYLDGGGAQTFTPAAMDSTPNSSVPIEIGSNNAGGRHLGEINACGIWGSALTAGQIASMYSAQAFDVIPELRPLNKPVWAYGATEERLMFYRRRLAA